MRPDIALIALALVLPLCAGSVAAEPATVDCGSLAQAVQGAGYAMTAPPAGPEDGWCVFDGAVLVARDGQRPDIHAKRLRLRGTEADGVPVSIEVAATGLRVKPGLGDRELDSRLRSLVQLQGMDLTFAATRNPATDTLELRGLVLRLSGGTEITLNADIVGAGLTAASLARGRLTLLELGWRNDGRLPQPLMEIAGERLDPSAKGAASVKAARDFLAALVAALPDAAFESGSKEAVARMVAALPQGRGRLTLALSAPEGIAAPRLVVAGLAKDPLGPEALDKLFAGVRILAQWEPGLTP